MQFLRAILTPLVAATLLAATAPLVMAQNRGDDTLLEMQQAFRKGDRNKLAQLLPAARGRQQLRELVAVALAERLLHLQQGIVTTVLRHDKGRGGGQQGGGHKGCQNRSEKLHGGII